MAYFVVSYDLIGKKDYERLTDRLKNGAVRAKKPVGRVESHMTASARKDDLKKYIKQRNRLLVIEFCQKPSGTRAYKKAVE